MAVLISQFQKEKMDRRTYPTNAIPFATCEIALFKLLQYDGLDFIEEYRVLLGLPVFNIAEDE